MLVDFGLWNYDRQYYRWAQGVDRQVFRKHTHPNFGNVSWGVMRLWHGPWVRFCTPSPKSGIVTHYCDLHPPVLYRSWTLRFLSDGQFLLMGKRTGSARKICAKRELLNQKT